MPNKEKRVETATTEVNNKETAIEKIIVDNIATIKLNEFHSKEYLEKIKETTYKGQEVVFVLPNGKEYK